MTKTKRSGGLSFFSMAKFIFWLGPAPSPWDPLTALDQGIGGSETAAIHMSRELAKLGHVVVVYADIHEPMNIDADEAGSKPYTVDVEWIPYRKMTTALPCDVFVSSRQPESRQRFLPYCKQAWLWMHDVHCGPDWENVLGTRYDKILCLSDWSKKRFCEYYPAVDAAKVQVTHNGVDGRLFEPFADSALPDKDVFMPGRQHFLLQSDLIPLRATFSSSPDRGLAKLLDLWPDVCNMAPRDHSELHVYYGFDNWRKIAQLQGAAPHVLRHIDLLEARVRQAPNVVYHGRAGQAEVARSYMRSQLWLSPSDFEETSCITAMEAQAAGCKIVATRCGAVPETAPGGYFVDGPTSRPGFDAQFLECVREALTHDSWHVRTPRSWAEVAQQWTGWL